MDRELETKIKKLKDEHYLEMLQKDITRLYSIFERAQSENVDGLACIPRRALENTLESDFKVRDTKAVRELTSHREKSYPSSSPNGGKIVDDLVDKYSAFRAGITCILRKYEIKEIEDDKQR